MIPAAVAAALEVRDGAPIGARNARADQCRECHQLTITGLDEDLLAFTARADLAPLNAHGELWALMTGRTTYDLGFVTTPSRTRRLRLTRRGRWDIYRAPAIGNTFDVVIAHRCGTYLDPQLTQPSNLDQASHDLPELSF